MPEACTKWKNWKPKNCRAECLKRKKERESPRDVSRNANQTTCSQTTKLKQEAAAVVSHPQVSSVRTFLSRPSLLSNFIMGMQGDLVNGLCYSLFLPAYLWLWISNPEPGAAIINALFLLVAATSWVSWCWGSFVASSIANAGMAASIACMNLYQWPHKGEVFIFPQYLWSLLIVSFNTSLPFAVKTGITVNALGTALLVASKSPLLSVADALPMLLSVTTIHTLFHYLADKRSKDNAEGGFLNARSASILLAGAFAYHMTLELSKMMQYDGYAMEGGYVILKAGIFASLGLAAAGAFQTTEATRDVLETLVVERTQAVAIQAEELRIVDYALQASETAIAITDLNQTIVWSNPALERLTNYSEKVRGAPLSDVLKLSPEMMEHLKGCFDPNSAGTTEVLMEGMNYAIDVSPFPASGVTWCPDCDSDCDCDCKDNPRFLVALKDVTERRAREQAEKLSEQEMFLKAGMKESMETLSHELRSPLQGIMGMASCLLDNESATAEEARESLSIIMASSRHLLTLINNLLDVRKCDANMMDEFPLSPVPLASSILDATTFCRPMAAVTNIQLDLTVDPSCGQLQVRSNTVRLQQVLINLVSNSIKYAPPASTVRLATHVMPYRKACDIMEGALALGLPLKDMSCASKDSSLVAVISVQDSGPGIPKALANRLFGKFAQASEHSSPSSSIIGGNHVAQPAGTGLGLNLCLKFVQRMNGNIWVSNNESGGACFSFFIPIDETEHDVEQTEASTVPSTSDTDTTAELDSCDTSKECLDYRVLVVDDTVINLKVLERMLKGIVAGKVRTASSGKEALTALEREPYDLVITDIQMPEMDGLQLTSAIRSNDKIPVKPFVVGLTAETNESLHGRCKRSGISLVLHKPVTATQLQRFIKDSVHTLQRCDEVVAQPS